MEVGSRMFEHHFCSSACSFVSLTEWPLAHHEQAKRYEKTIADLRRDTAAARARAEAAEVTSLRHQRLYESAHKSLQTQLASTQLEHTRIVLRLVEDARAQGATVAPRAPLATFPLLGGCVHLPVGAADLPR